MGDVHATSENISGRMSLKFTPGGHKPLKESLLHVAGKHIRCCL